MRCAGREEAPALARLHAEAFDAPWSERALAGFMGDAGVFALAAGEPVDGFILIRAMAGEAEILTLAVRPAARRRGAGRALVTAGADEALQRGAACLFLEVAADNAPAIGLYEGAGFVQVGRRAGYYRRGASEPMDALVLRLDLTASSA